MDANPGVTRGYYSLIRYSSDPVRGEYRNVGVLFVDESGDFSGLRAVLPGRISRTIEEHGLIAGLIAGIEKRLISETNGLLQLHALVREYSHSLVFSDPRPAMASGRPESLLDTLYLALVAPKAPISVGFTKGHVLDRLARWVRAHGAFLEIGAYRDGHLFDGVLDAAGATYVLSVTSLAARQVVAGKVEQEVGSFLFAAPRVADNAMGVLQPAPAGSSSATIQLQEKVASWFEEARVPLVTPAAWRASILPQLRRDHRPATQLELVMSHGRSGRAVLTTIT